MLREEDAARTVLKQIKNLRKAAGKLGPQPNTGAIGSIKEKLGELQPVLEGFAAEEPALMAHLICKNVSASLENVEQLNRKKPSRVADKIRFELLPLIDELYVDLFFWGLCYPVREKMQDYYQNHMERLCPFPYIKQDRKKGAYRYEVSIIVVAYNKLEYTKKCIQHILQYFPAHISHELILVNNGSVDGTKEYFESVGPTKQIDIAHNTKSFSVVGRVVEGEYILFVSNDVLLTPGAVSNMLDCIKSDPDVGCVVPTCPHVSCYQHIPAAYKNLDEMITFARQNNQPDPYRREQRARLVPPMVLTRSEWDYFYAFAGYRYPYFSQRFLAFSDDLMSMLVRRSGRKNILAKDAYVFHFGSVTMREDAGGQLLTQGRIAFLHAFGTDPWGKGFCFDPVLMEALPFEATMPVNILGVNCGMGSNPLKIKELLKEKAHNLQVTLYNATQEEQYWPDLEQLSHQIVLITDGAKLSSAFSPTVFQYIIVDHCVLEPEILERTAAHLFTRLEKGGVLAIRLPQDISPTTVGEGASTITQAGSWTLIHR